MAVPVIRAPENLPKWQSPSSAPLTNLPKWQNVSELISPYPD